MSSRYGPTMTWLRESFQDFINETLNGNLVRKHIETRRQDAAWKRWQSEVNKLDTGLDAMLIIDCMLLDHVVFRCDDLNKLRRKRSESRIQDGMEFRVCWMDKVAKSILEIPYRQELQDNGEGEQINVIEECVDKIMRMTVIRHEYEELDEEILMENVYEKDVYHGVDSEMKHVNHGVGSTVNDLEIVED